MLPKAKSGWSTINYSDGYSAFYMGRRVYLWDYNPKGRMWKTELPQSLSEMVKDWQAQGYRFISREEYLTQ